MQSINPASLLASLGFLVFVSSCGSDKSSNQPDMSSDMTSTSTTSSGTASTSASHTGGHTSSATTQGSQETSDEESSEEQTSDETASGSSSEGSDSSSASSTGTSGNQESSSGDGASTTTGADSTSGEESTSGSELSAYERLCSSCHGPTGDGVEQLGPDIKHPVEDYSEWVIRNGRNGTTMLAFDTQALSDDELDEILEFLAAQEQPTTGEGLYMDYCAACHGDDGAGGPTMRPVVNEAHEAEELVRNGHGGSNFSDRREYMPKWSEAELTDMELELIVSFIETL